MAFFGKNNYSNKKIKTTQLLLETFLKILKFKRYFNFLLTDLRIYIP